MQVEGKAWMVNDPEEINTLDLLSDEEKTKMKDMVLVKVKMLKAEYHETGSINRSAKTSWWQNAVANVYTWFRSGTGAYRPEVFHPASLN